MMDYKLWPWYMNCLLPNITVILQWPQKVIWFSLLQWLWKHNSKEKLVINTDHKEKTSKQCVYKAQCNIQNPLEISFSLCLEFSITKSQRKMSYKPRGVTQKSTSNLVYTKISNLNILKAHNLSILSLL